MRNHKTIALALLIPLIILGALVVATRGSRSYAAPDKKTVKVLRKKDQLAVKPTAQEVAAQSPLMERELEDKIPKHLPLKIKIKNLNNEKWARDLEVEVMNTGDKPIYYLSFSLSLPDVKSDGGITVGFPLKYGRLDLSDFKNRPLPEDVPIQPGETYTLKVPENLVKGWGQFRGRRNLPEPRKFEIKFRRLHYGDGTGFVSSGGLPFPKPNVPRASCGEKKEGIADALSTVARSNPPHDSSLHFASSIMPVNFASAKFSAVNVAAMVPGNAPPQSNLCCWGSGECYYGKEVENGQTCSTCGPASWVESVGCDSPEGFCGKIDPQYRT